MIETLETYLLQARQSQTPVHLVLGGRIDAPVGALVVDRNGPTFEFAVGPARIRMELSAVIVLVA